VINPTTKGGFTAGSLLVIIGNTVCGLTFGGKKIFKKGGGKGGIGGTELVGGGY